ncbi:S66 family peptidase [Bacillus horti]|uniref:Muramoyltetrapeptide carboxypeptidase LdcA involved in peptidoglycan recycling n=1 Tax=Caldalkalibacillus horti TaxID=77523 RepID=A0ABT9VVZ7_9BACI|nr:S66 peptidase family protein [Bacillus horti]MDQ0164805.1 muramoyltetrapeptide carboxypeptidase LdcA involved in peptidoglycan recycling [Bacillus horti]
MIKYPLLTQGAAIGVTSPSSGVNDELHDLLYLSFKSLESKGYTINSGQTIWTQHKAKSAPAIIRANEFNKMMTDEQIDIIIPPWGGELLIEILEHLDLERYQPKWVLGYSDTSVLLLAITLNTGIATAHGTNLIDLRGEYSDSTTEIWQSVLSTKAGKSIVQYSSEKFQKQWNHSDPSPCVFHLTEETKWKTVTNTKVRAQGRLLGGCIDVIRHLIGTPYGDVKHFQQQYINNEPFIWYIENCQLSTTELRRSLVQMKLAGWFDHCSCLLFGRSDGNRAIDQYTVEDIYKELYEELKIPVVYDIDCGHVPPQITFINGAHAEIEVEEGRGIVKQLFI